MNAFICYYQDLKDHDNKEFSMIEGEIKPVAIQHAKGIVSIKGNAKLISSNDSSGFTYRGRFVNDKQAFSISYEASQKAHNALKWLIANQGVIRGERAYFKKALTPWETVSFHYRKVDASSATDADLDIATALILMNYRTGKQEYLDDAKTIINAIWDEEIQKNDLLILSGNTGMWTTDPTYNLSYFSPVAIRLFAKVDGNHNWNGVLDNMYTYMKKIQDAGTGVFPDWSDATGAAKNPPNGAAGKNENTYTWYRFDKESVRIPWRIAWDYYWFQDDRAKAILTTLNDFISKKSSGDPTNVNALGTSYTWNTDLGPDKAASGTIPSQWLGAWCATGIAGNKTWLDACTQEVNKKSVSNTVSSYFPDILLSMYSQLLNGAYLMPF